MASLTFAICANPICAARVPDYKTSGLCGNCRWRWNRFGTPVAGYIPSFTLLHVSTQFFKEHKPAQGDIEAAMRILRGARYPTGPWADRPAYRLQPLLHRRANQRLPHLLVGRRKVPTLRSLGMALVHHSLAERVMGTPGLYAQYLTGATYYCRRGASAPKGAEVLTGGAGHTGYKLHRTDFTTIGREVLKASKVLGLPQGSTDRIVELYHEGLAAGRYQAQVVVPLRAYATTACGDHPFDMWLPKDNPHVPPQYRGKVRRASGRIACEWPEGLDLSWEDQAAQKAERRAIEQSRRDQHKVRTGAPPSVDWIFNCTG